MATALVAASVLSACGGGGTAADEAGVPVASTSQEMGSAGGTLSLQELSLTLPASALTESVQLSLQRETVASPVLARFRLSPAGHALSVPAELRYSATGLAANVRFFWEVNGEQWLIPGNISAGVLTSFITSLGYTAAGTVIQAQDVEQPASLTERAQAAVARVLPLAESASEGGSLVVQPVDCDAHITVLKTRMARAATDGDQNRAVAVFNELQATREVCAGIRAEELAQASCDALAVAQSNAQVLVASSLGAFSELTVPLYAADAFVQNTGATCSNADLAANQALIDAKFDQLLDVMKGQMARAEFDDALTVRDLRVVMHMDEMCQKVDLGAGCDRLRTELYPDLLDALRSSAFEECRSGGNPQSVSQFYALGSQARVEDKFFGHARFPLAAVEADLNYCSNPALGLRVFDGEDVPGELTDRATTLRPLVALGNYAKQTSIEVPRDGSLNIAGTVGVLRCPDGSASSADLVFRVNGQEWVRRAASGDGYPLESAPLLLDLPTVLPGFGIDPSTSTGFTVTVNREGGGCSDGKQVVLSDSFTLFTVTIGLPQAMPFGSQVVYGTGYSCAITSAGGVRCTGSNDWGQLGDGTTTPAYGGTMVDVVGLTTGVVGLSGVGGYRTCAITSQGGVKCWGLNNVGQLGNGTTNNSSTPVDVIGLSSGVLTILGDAYTTCALTSGGGVKCWGSNLNGLLGIGNRTDSSTPVDASGLLSGVKAIRMGNAYYCVLMNTGGVKCWGYNYYSLGLSSLTPVDVIGRSW